MSIRSTPEMQADLEALLHSIASHDLPRSKRLRLNDHRDPTLHREIDDLLKAYYSHIIHERGYFVGNRRMIDREHFINSATLQYHYYRFGQKQIEQATIELADSAEKAVMRVLGAPFNWHAED